MWLVVAVRHFAVRRERWIPRSWCGLCRLLCASFAASVLRDRFRPWIKHDAPEFPDQRRQFGGLPHELLRFGECCLPEVVASGMCVTRYLVPHSEARLSGPPCFLVCFRWPSRLPLIAASILFSRLLLFVLPAKHEIAFMQVDREIRSNLTSNYLLPYFLTVLSHTTPLANLHSLKANIPCVK